MRKGTLPVIAGNPPADGSQPFGINGMMVTVPTNVAMDPRVRTHYGSQNVTVAAMQMAEKKVWAQRS